MPPCSHLDHWLAIGSQKGEKPQGVFLSLEVTTVTITSVKVYLDGVNSRRLKSSMNIDVRKR